MSIEQENSSETTNLKRLAEKFETNEINRDLVLYLAYFDLKVDDLKDKKILDVGAGSAYFAKDAKNYGVNVTALDPMYLLERGRQKFFQEKVWQRIKRFLTGKEKDLPAAVAAIGEELPFKDGSFDLITSVYSAYHHTENKVSLKKNILEAVRVLKPGGQLLVYPVSSPGSKDILTNENDDVQQEFSDYFWTTVKQLEEKNVVESEIGYPRSPSNKRLDLPDEMKYVGFVRVTKK